MKAVRETVTFIFIVNKKQRSEMISISNLWFKFDWQGSVIEIWLIVTKNTTDHFIVKKYVKIFLLKVDQKLQLIDLYQIILIYMVGGNG